jgi:hypothetical protein
VASQVDIVNLALGKLSHDRTISAMGEQSKEARVAGRVWDTIRDEVLEARNWPFAMKAQVLAPLAEAPIPGWCYRYAYPNDCLSLRAVTDEGGVRRSRLHDWMHLSGAGDWTVAHGAQDTSILTNTPEAYAIYTVRVTDPARYSAHFINALATRLAAEMAPTIIGERGGGLQQAIMDPRGGSYMIALSNAGEHALNETRIRSEAMTPSLAARL